MRVHLVFVVYFLVSYGLAQTKEGKVISQVTTVPVDDGSVTVLHLSPGFATSVRLPEEANSIVIGNPGAFKRGTLGERTAAGFSEAHNLTAGREQRPDYD